MLFTIGNPKTQKGEARGYLTAVLHLAPHELAGVGNMCPRATAGCIAMCLNTAGRGGIFKAGATTNAVQEARKRRTREYMADPDVFAARLMADVIRLRKRANRMGLTLAVRVNGTSDQPRLARRLALAFPDVQFYDYTKLPAPWLRELPNYHMTFSLSERNKNDAAAALRNGISVAVVFSTRKGKALPAYFAGRKVIDGDAHDLRFLDPRGVIVGLRAKGRARRDTSGFVVQV